MTTLQAGGLDEGAVDRTRGAMVPSPAPRARDGSHLLEVTDLAVHFSITTGVLLERVTGQIKAVDGVSLTIRRGSTLGLVGESGCGKSTVGRAIMRIVRPTGGRIVFDGVDITRSEGRALRAVRRRMQMVFQDPYASLDPRMHAAAIVREPLDIHGIGSGAERRARVRELFEVVGLDPRLGSRYPHEFSGGQRQRIGVARALAVGPDLIVADEPVSSLDVSVQAQLINLLERLQAQFHLTFLFIAHDLSVVRHISHDVAVMYLGRIVEVVASRDLVEQARHPYTIALLSAVPIPDPIRESRRARIVLSGDVPSPANPPSGCAFHPRCWLYERLDRPDRCRTEQPGLAPLGSEQQVACHFPDRAREAAGGSANPGAVLAGPVA